jgi:DNA recombination protein RmuC
VDSLSSKKYWDISGNSPELVICFLPAESILAAALTADPALLDHALSKNVVLASPGTLLAVLKSVAFTWRQDVLTDSARELFELARQLYERMGTLGDNVSKLGSSLKSSVDRYNSMVGTLEARVLPTARKLNAMDAAGLVTPPAVQVTPRSVSAPELQSGDQAAAQSTGQLGAVQESTVAESMVTGSTVTASTVHGRAGGEAAEPEAEEDAA